VEFPNLEKNMKRVIISNILRRRVHAEAKITSLGLSMPSPAVPKGSFVNYVKINNLVFLSGHLPQPAEGNLVVGQLGTDLTIEEGD
jgi:enamine deaminase RidA (YjgF/YER057c/UK114 family)